MAEPTTGETASSWYDDAPITDEQIESVRGDLDTPPAHGGRSFAPTVVRKMLAEIDRLHTWDGLMSLLDRHYPPDVFDGSSGDPGPRIIALTRENDRLRATQPPLTDEYGLRITYVSTRTEEGAIADTLDGALEALAAFDAKGRDDVLSRKLRVRKVGQWQDIEEGDDRG